MSDDRNWRGTEFAIAFAAFNVAAVVLGAADYTGRAYITELLWFDVGVIGLWFSAANVYSVFRDRAELRASGRNGILAEVVEQNIEEEVLRLGKATSITVVGIVAMISPPAVAKAPVTATAIALTIGLFLIAGMVVAGAIRARQHRRKIDRMLADDGERPAS